MRGRRQAHARPELTLGLTHLCPPGAPEQRRVITAAGCPRAPLLAGRGRLWPWQDARRRAARAAGCTAGAARGMAGSWRSGLCSTRKAWMRPWRCTCAAWSSTLSRAGCMRPTHSRMRFCAAVGAPPVHLRHSLAPRGMSHSRPPGRELGTAPRCEEGRAVPAFLRRPPMANPAAGGRPFPCVQRATRTGKSLPSPSAITSTASAARISPIRRVITLMPVLPSTRAMGSASAKHTAVARAMTTP